MRTVKVPVSSTYLQRLQTYLFLQVMTYLFGVCLIGAGFIMGLTVG